MASTLARDVRVELSSPHERAHARSRRRWRIAKNLLSAAFFVVVLGAIAWYIGAVEWDPVWQSLRTYKTSTLLLAGTIAVLHCLLYASFDLLTKPHKVHGLARRLMYPVAFTSYTFNMNLGPWIGSLGIRLRQYSRLGLGSAQILRILVFTTLTNWVGYVFVAGLVFALRPPPVLPADWPIGAATLRTIGFVLLGVVAAYWAVCAFSRKRTFTIHKLHIRLPSGGMAVLQAVLAGINWLLIALVAWLVLRGIAPYESVVATILLAAIAGTLVHIPGGLGVVEGVILAVLGGDVPRHEMVAALVVYRAIYYLWPFALGVVTFATVETLARRKALRAAAG